MNDELKVFIENNIDLIDNNDWTTFYEQVNRTELLGLIGQLTNDLWDAGIRPEQFMTELPTCFLLANKKLINFAVPNGITKIGKSAFGYCSNLVSVKLPESIKEIERSAFVYCYKLPNIYIPSQVRRLNEYTFNYCGLENITFGNTSQLNAICDNAFAHCINLTDITIPEGVTFIGQSAFMNCDKLKYVNLPNSILNIESSAFFNCPSLTELHFNGTKDQFKQTGLQGKTMKQWINIDTLRRIICRDGEIIL